MKEKFGNTWRRLKQTFLPIALSSFLVASVTFAGEESMELCCKRSGPPLKFPSGRGTKCQKSKSFCNNLFYVANQVNSTDFYLANRIEFYGVWPNAFYTSADEGGIGFFNTSLPGLYFSNPKNPNHLIGNYTGDNVAISQNGSFPGFPLLRRNPITISNDCGKSWNTTFAPTLNLSQSALVVPQFASNGKTIYALGFFTDTYTNPSELFDFTYWTSYLPHPYGPASIINPTGPIFENEPSMQVSRNNLPIDPNTVIAASNEEFGLSGTANPACGLFICKSTDGGKSFSNPVLISATQSDSFFGFLSEGSTGQMEGANGLVEEAGSLIIDPENPKILNAIWTRIDNLSFLWGSLYGSRSTDGGRTWTSNPNGDNQLINLTNSPLYALEFDNNFQKQIISTDPNYLTNFPNVGQAVSTGIIAVEDVGQGGNKGNPVYLCGSNREYPKPNQPVPTFTDSPTDTLVDHVVIISKDKGKTWGDGRSFRRSKVNSSALPQYIFASAHDPRFSPSEIGLIIVDGALNQTLAASPKTGRVYYVWEGGNFAISSDPLVNQHYPEIQMSVSSGSLDVIGQHWTNPVKVNRTPDDLSNPEKSQAFNCNVAVNKKGIVAVVYNDFRNFDTSQVNNPHGTVNTTTWIDFYKELRCPYEGDLGNGLTFIGEIQVSPIYDSSVAGGTPFTGITTGTFVSISVDANDNFVVAYPVTNVNNGTQSIPPNFPPYSGFNILENTSNRSNTFIKVIPFPSCG